MTETMPLGFDFNKQFKSHYLQSNILLMLQAVLFFYAGTQLANPANTNNKLFISSSNWLLPYRKQLHTYICKNSVISSDSVKRLLQLKRSCVIFVCVGRQLQNVEGGELKVNMYLFHPILVHSFLL